MRATLQDEARIKAHGYTVEACGDLGFTLQDSSCGPNDYLMIGSHGCVSPTRWEAVAEGLFRIDEDERHERELTEMADAR